MSIKALYVGECHRFIDKTLAQLEQIHTQIKNIQKRIEGIIALEEAFKGKTANSVRIFYKEVHQPFLLFLEGFIDNYSNTLREIKQSIDELELDRNGVIREDFLAGGVQRGLKRAEHIAMMLTDEANAVLRSVRDIIDVKDLDDGEFMDKVQHATDGRKVRRFKSETGINYELVHTIPASRQKPKEPEKSWLQKAADGTKNAFVKAGEFGATAVKETADFLILDDVNTILIQKHLKRKG